MHAIAGPAHMSCCLLGAGPGPRGPNRWIGLLVLSPAPDYTCCYMHNEPAKDNAAAAAAAANGGDDAGCRGLG
jgi:hypothetical protein